MGLGESVAEEVGVTVGVEVEEREGSFGRGVDRFRVTKLLSFTVESSFSECGETGDDEEGEEEEEEDDEERSRGPRL